MIAAFVYERTLAPEPDVVVNVGTDEVVITQGKTRIVVPREVHDAIRIVEPSPRFRKGVGGVTRTIQADEAIESIGICKDEEDEKPPVEIRRKQFAVLPESLDEVEGNSRDLTEVTDLEILRTILERSKRRWQFVWNGVRISAPVTDDRFYDDFFAHRITIAPGDVL